MSTEFNDFVASVCFVDDPTGTADGTTSVRFFFPVHGDEALTMAMDAVAASIDAAEDTVRREVARNWAFRHAVATASTADPDWLGWPYDPSPDGEDLALVIDRPKDLGAFVMPCGTMTFSLSPVGLVGAKQELSSLLGKLTRTRPALRCLGCGRAPDQISDYVAMAEDEDVTPDEYVWREEGTLDRTTGSFLCDACYIESVAPTAGPDGWTA